MELVKTTLDGVYIIKPDVFRDFRGDYMMTYHKDTYEALFSKVQWIEHCVSTSTKNVLRGIHYSPNCWKIYQCLYGKLYYVFVNCDENDPEFGKWESFVIDGKNYWQLVKPPKYGAGFISLTNYSILYYLQSQYYDADNPDQKTFKWDDPRFNIFWPIKPILSRRDEIGNYIS